MGTLTPKQVMDMSIEEIPAVLALVRESKDGPQQQTVNYFGNHGNIPW